MLYVHNELVLEDRSQLLYVLKDVKVVQQK